MQVFATVMEILNDFVEYFEYDVQTVYFTADKGDGTGRSKLYTRLMRQHAPDGFSLEDIRDTGDEIAFTVVRQH